MTPTTDLTGRIFKVPHQHRWYRIEVHLVQPGFDSLGGIECYADGRPVPDGAEMSGSPFIVWTRPDPFDETFHGHAWELDLGPRAYPCYLVLTPAGDLVVTTLQHEVAALAGPTRA